MIIYFQYICIGKEQLKGTKTFPSSFSKFEYYRMSGINLLKNIEDFITGILSKDEDIFLVEIKISPTNDIKVFLDADNGITIEKCTKLNKALYKYIDESALFPDGNFSLEVSSPGVDEPLKLNRQYKKNIGRKVEVIINDGSKFEGLLSSVDDEQIIVEEKTGKGSKTTINSKPILFNQIKFTKVLITF